MNKTWKAVLGVVLIFIFGWVTGAVSAGLFIRHKTMTMLNDPPAMATALERRLTRGLTLDDGQKKTVYDAILKNLTQRTSMQQGLQPQIQELNRQTMTEVDAILKPDQQERFRENYQNFRSRFGNAFSSGADGAAAPAPSPASQ